MSKRYIPQSRNLIASIAIVSFVTFAIGGAFSYFMMKQARLNLDQVYGTVIQNPRIIAPFTLQQGDKSFTQANLSGDWSLVFFGFTRCGYICPTAMSDLNKIYTRLQNKKAKHIPQVVFVSVDPERDDPKTTLEYAASFNKNFMGVTGSQAQIEKMARDFAVVYLKVGEGENYDVDHSGTILLINPRRQLQAVYSMPHDVKKIAKSIMQITSTLS